MLTERGRDAVQDSRDRPGAHDHESVLGVDVRRDLLQILDETRLKGLERLELAADERDEARRCFWPLSGGYDIPIDVIDEGCIERLLSFEERTDEAPYQTVQPAAPTGTEVGAVRLH